MACSLGCEGRCNSRGEEGGAADQRRWQGQRAGTERRGKFAALAVSAGAMRGGWYTRSRGHGCQGQGSKIRGRGAGTCVAADQSEGTRGVKQGCEGTGDSRGEEEGGAKG